MSDMPFGLKYADSQAIKAVALSIIRRWSSPGPTFNAGEPEAWFGPVIDEMRTKPLCSGVPERVLLGDADRPGLLALRLQSQRQRVHSQVPLQAMIQELVETGRIERVTDDSTRYERSDGGTTSEPVLRINMAWLPQYAADTLRFLLTRRVDTNPPHMPATFSTELLQRLSRIVIECANRRGEQCLVRLPPDIDDGYLQLNDLFHRMGFWTCVADLGRFDGQPPYWPEGADRTISGDVLAEMATALKLIAGAGEGNAAAEQSAEFPGPSGRADGPVSPVPQEIATTPDEAVRMVGDEWATYAELERVTGIPEANIRAAFSNKGVPEYDRQDVYLAGPTSAKSRFRIRGVWKLLPQLRVRTN